MQKHAGSKGLLQLAAAVAMLALLGGLFLRSPLRESITGQLFALNYLHAGWLRKMADGPPGVGRRAEDKSGAESAIGADLPGGFYDGPIQVTLAQSTRAPIFYTLDGSMPTARSARYAEPIPIERTTVLSFTGMKSQPAARPIEIRTFLIGEPDGLPVVSLAVNPEFLWNRHSGLYRNPHKRGMGWRRPAHVEYFQDRYSRPLRFSVEMKIHGGWSRLADKKSFQLSYVTTGMPPERSGVLSSPEDGGAQRAVVVRAAAMDVSYRLGDELFRDLYAEGGGATVPAVPVLLFLNGTAWGLYNLHEKVDQAFLQRHYGPADYDLVDDPLYRKSEEDGAWNRMLDFFVTHDLSQETHFEKASRLIDVENFTDYWLFNIYTGNVDWPHNNYYAFRKRAPGERWRWLSWDTDATFDVRRGLPHDTLSWATRSELRHDLSYNGDEPDWERWLVSTAIIRSLLKNRAYRDLFVRRFCALHDTYFQPDRLKARFQGILARMTPHLDADWRRWPGSKEAFLKGVQGVRRFIRERPAIVLEHFRKRFALSDCPAM